MPMPSMLISSVAAGMAADIVAVFMSIDVVLDIPDMVLDIPDMSMAVVVAVCGWTGLVDVCDSARGRVQALCEKIGKVVTVC